LEKRSWRYSEVAKRNRQSNNALSNRKKKPMSRLTIQTPGRKKNRVSEDRKGGARCAAKTRTCPSADRQSRAGWKHKKKGTKIVERKYPPRCGRRDIGEGGGFQSRDRAGEVMGSVNRSRGTIRFERQVRRARGRKASGDERKGVYAQLK